MINSIAVIISITTIIYLLSLLLLLSILLAQDKGGPSKGGFLNNRSFSRTVLSLCYETNGVYKP